MTRPPSRPTCVVFLRDVLRIPLTTAQRVLVKVCIDGLQPKALRGAERVAARVLLGPEVDEIDPRLRRVLAWLLGRDSGKSTLAAGIGIWSAAWCDLSRVGPGHLPVSFVVAPTRPLAKIGVGIARGLLVDTDLERAIVADTAHGFVMQRPDGRRVEVASVAAAKGGANLRGRPVCHLTIDEAQLMGTQEGGAVVNDREQLNAVMPRLLGQALFISTPWPSDNVMAEYVERNHGHPIDAVAAIGESMLMRPSPQLEIDVARETERDPENADREYRCVVLPGGSTRVFDPVMVDRSVDDARPLTMTAPSGSAVGAGGDVAFERDSSAIAIVSRIDDRYQLLELDEIRPSRGKPLVPGHVVGVRFAPIMKRHAVGDLMVDGYYKRSVEEHLRAASLNLSEAPEGNGGKYDTYMHTRAVMHGGKLVIPKVPRLISQLKAVSMTPIDKGKTKITSPRRAGGGHGDLVSALVLAAWAAHERSAGGRPFVIGPPISAADRPFGQASGRSF